MCRTLRIVVADDERDTREYLRELLEQLGHHAEAAEDGPQLVSLCLERVPDLVITDVCMPGLDGLQAAAEVCRGRQIPFVVISGGHSPGDLARAAAVPVMAYLVKPVSEPHIRACIPVAVARFEELRAAREEAERLRRELASSVGLRPPFDPEARLS